MPCVGLKARDAVAKDKGAAIKKDRKLRAFVRLSGSSEDEDANVPLTAIRRFLDRPDAVVFIGSGISCWAGLPNWRRMSEELAEFLDENGESYTLLRREVADSDLLQAASYGFSKLTPLAIGEFVRKAVQLGSAKPCEIHKAIVQLGPSCYITTNYDNLIEQALSMAAGRLQSGANDNRHSRLPIS